jgi:hypothetical protein
MNSYQVSLFGHDPIVVEAETLAKARWKAFVTYKEVYRDYTFRSFLHVVCIDRMQESEGGNGA